jgi:cobalt-zinc-cadmium efflux system protein
MTEHSHSHEHHRTSQRALLLALVFTTFFAVIEALAGWWSNSLALIGDAGHMITDSLALGFGALAAWISRKPPSARHSYGLKRAEVVGALLNVVFMLGVVIYIGIEAVARLATPEPVEGSVVMLVAVIGLAVNLGAAWVLHRSEPNLNVQGAMLHVMGDLLGSVAAIVAGGVIWASGWYPIDPLLSIFIGVLIVVGSYRLLRDVLHIVMEGVPKDVDLERVARNMANAPTVRHIHDLHIWALDSATYAISAHVVIENMADWAPCHRQLETMLASEFGITHTTLQPETTEAFAAECANGSCGMVFTNTRLQRVSSQ